MLSLLLFVSFGVKWSVGCPSCNLADEVINQLLLLDG